MSDENAEWRGKIKADVQHVKDDVNDLKQTTTVLKERQAEMWLWFKAIAFLVAGLVVAFSKNLIKAFWE